MNDQDLVQSLIAGGESQVVEFKNSLSLTREGLQSLCGMLNSETGHGTILFGVSPTGQVTGVESGNLDKAQRSLCQKISAKFDPPITPSISIWRVQGKSILALHARRLPNIPLYEFDGRAFIREGTRTRRLTLSEKKALIRSRDRNSHTGLWKCDRCGGLVGMLVSVEVRNGRMVKSYKCSCGGEYWPAA